MPRARKTVRLTGRLTAVGLALGGAAGARLGCKLGSSAGAAAPAGAALALLPRGLNASRNTLLRLVRRAPLPAFATPSALGADDWALRKRHSYGTVLADLERRRPVALLPDREADTLAAWLRERPGVAVIARDRAGAYAKGARDGALRDAEQARREAMLTERGAVPMPPAKPRTKVRLLAAERRQRRMARHARVWALRRQGWSGEKTAPHLGIGRTTVYRFLRSQVFPERQAPSDAGRSLLDPWRRLVLEHWDGDRRSGPAVLRELQRHGYQGSCPTLARYLRRLRMAQAAGAAPAGGSAARPRPVLAVAPSQALTPRTAAWLVLRRAERRNTEDGALLAELRRHAPELDEAISLAEAFVGLVRDRAPDCLDPWLRRAEEGAVRQMQGFAKRLSADHDAMRAAVTLDWSNGQTEGQINRLKTIKRQLYGRAGLDLLGRRFLLAALSSRVAKTPNPSRIGA